MTAPKKPAAKKTAPKTAIPAGAKKPSDRQTASEDVVPEDRIFNWRGTDYEVVTDRLDDLEFVEKLERNLFAGALYLMLGESQYEAFKAQVKAAEGRVSIASTQSFIEEYMEFARRGN